MSNNKQNVWQPLIYALLLAIGIGGGYFLQNRTGNNLSLTGNKKLDQVIGLINSSYVDTVDSKELTEEAIVEMLHNLDPHSSYIPAEDLKEVNQQLEGNFEGIGIEFNLLDDTIFVATVLHDGPAEKAGLMAGDRIVQVEDEVVAGIGIQNSGVAKRLKGEKGTKVSVKVKRLGEKELLDFTITRGRIPLYSVEASYMMSPEIGYIKLVSFSKDTYDELTRAIRELKDEGMESLVLDLRDNPGGYLHAATGVASEFLGDGKLMVYTEGRKNGKKEYKTNGTGSFTKGKLVVLINEGSASASEIVSGAVQDWDRGIIVGRRTFGKGLVQEPFQLADGSQIRLTIARYYTPTGRSIQKPYAQGFDTYEEEISNRYKAGEFDHPDSVKKNKKLEYKTPSGRKVYGGGGVYPDVFVAADSAFHSGLFTQIVLNGFVNRVAYRYSALNKKSIKANYKTGDDFVKNFNFKGQLQHQIESLLAKSDIAFDGEELQKIMPTIKRRAKATIARQLYDRETFYKALNSTDNTVSTALDALSNYKAILKGTSNLVSK